MIIIIISPLHPSPTILLNGRVTAVAGDIFCEDSHVLKWNGKSHRAFVAWENFADKMYRSVEDVCEWLNFVNFVKKNHKPESWAQIARRFRRRI